MLKALERKARFAGKTPREYIRLLIEKDVLADKTFDEILRPVRDDVRKNGITEEQVDAAVDRARSAIQRAPRRTRK